MRDDYSILVDALASGDETAWAPLIDYLIEHWCENAGLWAKWARDTGRAPFVSETHLRGEGTSISPYRWWICRWAETAADVTSGPSFKKCRGGVSDTDDLPDVFLEMPSPSSGSMSLAKRYPSASAAWRAFFEYAAVTPFR